MHHHLEIVMPPTDQVEEAIQEIMQPYCEHNKPDEEGWVNPHTFWDWYVIGGRWGGAHLRAGLDPETLEQFWAKLDEMKVTVSGVICGKQELQPISQIAEVDEAWRQFFPNHELKQCPFFAHFNNQYCNSCIDADPYGDISDQLTASHLIIGGRSHDDIKWTARDMLLTEIWNGATWQNTNWDGNVKEGVEILNDKIKHAREDWRKANTVRDDWLVVTVDYHS